MYIYIDQQGQVHNLNNYYVNVNDPSKSPFESLEVITPSNSFHNDPTALLSRYHINLDRHDPNNNTA